MHFFTHNEAFALKMWHAFGSNFRETHSLRSLVNVSSVHVNSFPDVVSILLCAPVLLHLSPTTYCHFQNSRNAPPLFTTWPHWTWNDKQEKVIHFEIIAALLKMLYSLIKCLTTKLLSCNPMLENTDRALYSSNYRENANHTGVPTCGLEIIRKTKNGKGCILQFCLF